MVQELFSVFPNHAAEMVHIFMQGIQGEFTIRIMDQLGKTVLQKQGSGHEQILDIRHLNAGLYYLGIEQNGLIKAAVQKLVLSH